MLEIGSVQTSNSAAKLKYKAYVILSRNLFRMQDFYNRWHVQQNYIHKLQWSDLHEKPHKYKAWIAMEKGKET